MTTLSRILLDPRVRGARKLIGNPQAMHAAVMTAFSAGETDLSGRVLWRLDSTPDRHVLYLVGSGVPDLRVIAGQACSAGERGDTADLGPFLDRLAAGQRWAFRLTANPVHTKAGERGTRGRVFAHVTEKQQLAWLDAKSNQHGFSIVHRAAPRDPSDDELAVEHLDAMVSQRRDLRFRKGNAKNPVMIRTARFDGHLEVTDVELLRRALTEGIGRARAYGCGLLSLAAPTG